MIWPRPFVRLRFPISISWKLFWSHWATAIVVSGSLGAYLYYNAVESLKGSLQARLQNSAAFIAGALNGADFDDIQKPQDVARNSYQQELDLLRRLQRTNPDISYLYVMRNDQGRIRFVVDTDDTPRQALPMRIYHAEMPAMRVGFNRPAVDDKIRADEWGHFMSGYAPIRGSKEQYLVGLDMRADEVYRKYHRLQMAGLISLAGSIALALVLSRMFARHFVGGIQTFAAQCEVIASGDFDQQVTLQTRDELDQLARAFNRMASQLGQARDKLSQANAELEERVRLRTRDLQEALANVKQLHGLLPMCAWCRKMRDDHGYWTELEQYLEAHADVKFSHGICPDCSKKFFQGSAPGPSV